MMKSFMEFIRDLKTTICITHFTLRVTCFWEYVYICTSETCWEELNVETLPHQEPDTCYDQIRYYELSKRNNLE